MMKVVNCIAAALVAAFSLVAEAAPKPKAPPDPNAAEIAALKKELKSCSAGYGIYTTQFMRRYAICDNEPWSEEQLAAALKRHYEILARLTVLAPRDADVRLTYGNTLLYYGRFAEAREQFRQAVAYETRDYEWTQAAFRLAEAEYALGNRAAALAALHALKQRGYYKVPQKRAPRWTWTGDLALDALEGRGDYNHRKLPRDTAAKAFPQPQQAQYRETFTNLRSVRIVLEGVDAKDARVRLLREKLENLGILADDAAAFTVSVARRADAPVEKPEGYGLTVTADGARIAARDAQGVLWGIVSFLQVIDSERRRIRHCEILDWPDTANRGYLNSFDPGAAEYAVFNKMNSVVLDKCPLDNNQLSPLRRLVAENMARRFHELGLTLYYYSVWFTQCEQLPISAPRTLPYRIAICKEYAKMNAGVYFPFDDIRYPLCAADAKAYGGSAIPCDAKHIDAIYKGVAAEYPDFRFIFCPPFYWGPDAKASIPDDREGYLRSIGEHLDPRVDVYWSGAQVKGLDKRPYQVKWFTDLTKHKPAIFQNAIRPHNLVEYLIDPIPWDKLHYPGFCRQISHFHHNANTHAEIGPIGTLADWLWNNAAYDAPRAARAAVGQFLGPKIYDILKEGLDDLAYFDKYRYGSVNANILYEDPADVQRKYEHAKAVWEKAVACNPDTAKYGFWGPGLDWAKGIVAAAKNPPDVLSKYKKQIAATFELALKESGAETNAGDRVLTPMDLRGLRPDSGRFGTAKTERFLKWLRGANTSEHSVSFEFECDPFPPTGAYALAICGIQHEIPEEACLRIAVNGKAVYEGPCGFQRLQGEVGTTGGSDFMLKEFKIPYESMKRHNTVTVSCASPGYNPRGTPYIGVNYMVLRKSR